MQYLNTRQLLKIKVRLINVSFLAVNLSYGAVLPSRRRLSPLLSYRITEKYGRLNYAWPAPGKYQSDVSKWPIVKIRDIDVPYRGQISDFITTLAAKETLRFEQLVICQFICSLSPNFAMGG
ncbi:hypothetical protein FOXG_20692 [Fusarium oxysporum f. sp. lycopersici 4287]|uniref:Uncharacterized protein n=1 Tax=Fusarium oxysporum f. sp. lycopersici (strain 4287 / CBS 123668 / FGSC 9935 / NRRL 34936) TaxID=426428 RepID=A0A0J9WRK0_FUSO4|nr:hypothetical protein FOXG_20692 [Fusarium oxysporum f. sp. lycopersici 4287]KNB12667.1 hypothetical protein FOXG_20692 [Fusarium oxysporum f. sp. lycopersici 4287]